MLSSSGLVFTSDGRFFCKACICSSLNPLNWSFDNVPICSEVKLDNSSGFIEAISSGEYVEKSILSIGVYGTLLCAEYVPSGLIVYEPATSPVFGKFSPTKTTPEFII